MVLSSNISNISYISTVSNINIDLFMDYCLKGDINNAKNLWQKNNEYIDIYKNGCEFFMNVCEKDHYNVAKWLWKIYNKTAMIFTMDDKFFVKINNCCDFEIAYLIAKKSKSTFKLGFTKSEMDEIDKINLKKNLIIPCVLNYLIEDLFKEENFNMIDSILNLISQETGIYIQQILTECTEKEICFLTYLKRKNITYCQFKWWFNKFNDYLYENINQPYYIQFIDYIIFEKIFKNSKKNDINKIKKLITKLNISIKLEEFDFN